MCPIKPGQMPETPNKRVIKDPLVGTLVDGRYHILAALGLGATSTVYKAEENSSGRLVGMKVLHPHLASDDALVARFEREARAAEILTHPNIVAVREYAISDAGIPYLIMDYVDGISLQDLLARDGCLPLSTAVRIFTQVCAALSAAHEKDVVHRDLKPGNIMLVCKSDNDYMVKLLDFGCAQMAPMLGDTVLKVTQTGEMLGSLLYMSPEQCLDGDVDGRSDCYSLGCVLYETLTGKPPLAARTAFETMNKHMNDMPDTLAHARPDLVFGKDVERIIFKAMAKSPAKRYQKITELMDDLTALSDIEPTDHRIAGSGSPASTSIKVIALLILSAMSLFTLIWMPVLYSAVMSVTGLAAILWIFKVLVNKRRTKQLIGATLANDETIRRSEAKAYNIDGGVIGGMPAALLAPWSDYKKTTIMIYGARKDGPFYMLNFGEEMPDKEELRVKPIEPHNLFWEQLCPEFGSGLETAKFPIKGTLLKAFGRSEQFIFLNSHVALVLK
jgi:serine/threonine protein kinase